MESSAKSFYDPIHMEIMWQRVISIAEECWVTIWRTSFSVVVGEALDYGCAILDAHGRVLAHPSRSMPAFNFALPNCAREILIQFPVDSLCPGDVLITNDPWLIAGHLFDIAVLTPVFNHQGKVVAFLTSCAHVADIGGTRARHTTREIYDEGLLIPPFKLYDGGEVNDLLIKIIRSNVRLPNMVMGDIHAMVSANQMGAERLLAFMDEYHLNDLEALTAEVQRRTERSMRKAISALPDGIYEADQYCDGVEEPFCFRVQVKVTSDSLIVDFLNVPAQLPYGGTNITYSILVADVVYVLKCILNPNVPGNDGDFRPITVKAPEGSVFNCRHPAAVNQRTRSLWTIAPSMMRALAPILSEKVQAPTGFPVSFKTYGITGDGDAFNDHMFQGGGQGACSQGDGQSTLLFPTSAGNVSVEMFEMRTGFLIWEKEFIPNSGGAGKFRGAPGQRVTVRRRPGEKGGRYQIGIWPASLRYANPGLFGGKAGNPMRLYTQVGSDGKIQEHYGGIFVDLDDQTSITLELPGGSGFGDPLERDPEAINQDLKDELLTEKSAREQYNWKAK
ncbi:MAG: hydantoinase B/oxoprolinase family protein [Deltaproteobacteria bacterium]|nr:hydantoinase B/oxoprolinase family protein [Deltaproteobacteria bacterium]